MNSLFSRSHSDKSKLQLNSESLDKISLRKKIIHNLDNLNINDTTDFLKIFLKTNKYYSTKIFIRFLLKEADLLSHYPVYDKRMTYKLMLIKGNLLKKGLIKPYNSQVFRIV